MSRSLVPVVLALLAVSLPAAADDQKPAASRPAAGTVVEVTKAPATNPADTPEARALRAALAQPAPRSMREALRRLQARRVNVEFKEISLTDAVRFVSRVAGFNVIVAPELQRDGRLEDMPRITLKLRDASLKQVVDLIKRFTGTELALEGSILVFTTPEAARGEPVLRIYSIAEITAKIRNFPGPDINLRPSGAEFEQEEPSEIESELADPDKIVEMIQDFVEKETWTDDGVSISADERKLVVRTYPHVQRKIARFLMLLRAAR